MAGGPEADASGPRIGLRQFAAQRDDSPDRWRIGWRIANKGSHTIRLLSVRLPHGQFRADEDHFQPPLVLGGGDSAEFSTVVCCHGPEGLVTENAFAIFSVSWNQQPWRIFVRVRVVLDAAGKPAVATESVTTQKVGFSGVAS